MKTDPPVPLAIALGLLCQESPFARRLAEQERKFYDLTAAIAAQHDLSVDELREHIRQRAAGEPELSVISTAYEVAYELNQQQLTDMAIQEMIEMRLKLDAGALGRVDAETLAKRRWQPAPSFKRSGSRN